MENCTRHSVGEDLRRTQQLVFSRTNLSKKMFAHTSHVGLAAGAKAEHTSKKIFIQKPSHLTELFEFASYNNI